MPKKDERSVFDRAMEAATESRRGAKTTQGDIAALAGISQESVHLWKTGGPRLKVALQFAQATGICVEWLYTGEGPKRPGEPTERTLAKVLAIWAGFTDLEKGRAFQAIKQIASESADDNDKKSQDRTRGK